MALQVQGQAIGLGEALGGGDYQGSRVGQGHEAQVEHALLRCIAARDPGQAVRASGVLVVRHLGCHLSANGADPEQPGPAGIDAIVINPLRHWSEYCRG
ncbi:hypothetical protein D3C81_1856230 [compost metagenome]